MQFKDVKKNAEYYVPSFWRIEKQKITDINLYGIYYEYTMYNGEKAGGVMGKQSGTYNPNDNIELFATKEEAIEHLRQEAERRINKL